MTKKTKDWPHQAREFKIGRNKRARYLIWPMRSGKSKACIDKACYQYGEGTIEGVIVIAPNGVQINWARNEIPKWAWPDYEHRAVAWITPKRADPDQIDLIEDMMAHDGPKWLTVNIEGLRHDACRKMIRKFIKRCHNKFMLIVSEAHHFGRAGARQTYFLRSLAAAAAFRQEESGTPVLASPLRAFSQYEVLQPGALGFDTYGKFKVRYGIFEVRRRGRSTAGQRYDAVIGYQNLDELRDRMAPWSSVVLREELKGMPDLVKTERPVIMSDLQRRAYTEMVNELLLKVGDETISGADAAIRMQKLQQIINGYIMKDGVIHDIDPKAPIYEALVEEVKGARPGKVLIWCRFREDIRRVVKALDHQFGEGHVLQYHGGVTASDREIARVAFAKNSRYFIMVGHPAAGGEGLDFSAADVIIYFSGVPNAVQINQSQERATVIGGKTIYIVRLRTYGTVDDRIWEIVDNREEMSEALAGHKLRDLLLRTDI